jgi:glycine cleavage system transcriptional repressor
MAAREFLILSATEPDRTGLIAELTGFIAERGCNVEDSRVVVLGGHAGLLFLISGEPAEIAAVVEGREALRERTGIRVAARRVPAAAAEPAEGGVRYTVEASALDHEGIIHAMADLVRRHGANIIELETSTESAPMSGEPLFAMRMTVALPAGGAGGERLERELEAAALEHSIDLEFRRVDAPAGAPPAR